MPVTVVDRDMYSVGSDLIAVADQLPVPNGRRHAVTEDGRALCRTTRPRFTWPALTWSATDDADACPMCAQVRQAEQAVAVAPAYPSEPVAAFTLALATPVIPAMTQPAEDADEAGLAH
jgi:hypothetical protein